MLKRLKALLMWGDPSPRARRHRLFCLACALIMLACIAYAASYFAEESRVRREGEVYRAMYSPAPLETQALAATATAAPRARCPARPCRCGSGPGRAAARSRKGKRAPRR